MTTRNLVRSALNTSDLRVLNLCYDGTYDSLLSDIFFQYMSPKTTFTNFLPILNFNKENVVQVDLDNISPQLMDIDCIICHGMPQFELANKWARTLHTPIVFVYHGDQEVPKFPQYVITVATNDYLQEKYRADHLVRTGVKMGEVKEKPLDVLVYGHFREEEFAFVRAIVKPFPNHRIVGFNPKLSMMPSSKEFEDLVGMAKVYINLNAQNDVLFPLLKALASNCQVVSNKTPSLEVFRDYIKFADDVGSFRREIQGCLDNPPPEGSAIGNFIIRNNNYDYFRKGWEKVVRWSKKTRFIISN